VLAVLASVLVTGNMVITSKLQSRSHKFKFRVTGTGKVDAHQAADRDSEPARPRHPTRMPVGCQDCDFSSPATVSCMSKTSEALGPARHGVTPVTRPPCQSLSPGRASESGTGN
jgi:hypothetical protein